MYVLTYLSVLVTVSFVLYHLRSQAHNGLVPVVFRGDDMTLLVVGGPL